MSAFGRMHKATALVPLAVLSAAWTASMAGSGIGSAVAGDEGSGALPDGTTIPAQAIEAPASVSVPGVVAPSVPRGQAAQIVDTASASGIPSAALAAYQRAEAVINAADTSCELPWQLIAAIGRVESDHGRFGGNVLSDDGVAEPGIYGIALNGRNNTQRITDTDAGQYDSDEKYDRAVGPMQFIPSTWTVVGVDGDNDGKRNPQDIDDAALATAVYLCSGDDDLSAEKGQRASVYRYNHSNDYVDLVLSIMQAYMDGEFTSVPTRTTSAGVFVPDPTGPTGPAQGQGPRRQGRPAGQPGRRGRHRHPDEEAHQAAHQDRDAHPAADAAAHPEPDEDADHQVAGPGPRAPDVADPAVDQRPAAGPDADLRPGRGPVHHPGRDRQPAHRHQRARELRERPARSLTRQASSRASRWRACRSVVPAGLRRHPPLPGSSMASQKAAQSGR